MELFGFDRYEILISERYSYLTENNEIREQMALSIRKYDGGELMLYIANELDKDDCIAVEFGDDFIKFVYNNYDTDSKDNTIINIRKEVD